MQQPSVMLMIGPIGIGKTTLATKFAKQLQGRMKILSPNGLREPFAHTVDWSECDYVALDEVSHWEKKSVAQAVHQLENEAQHQGKKLLLILQHRSELDAIGIHLRSEPAVLETSDRDTLTSANFIFNGRTISFP